MALTRFNVQDTWITRSRKTVSMHQPQQINRTCPFSSVQHMERVRNVYRKVQCKWGHNMYKNVFFSYEIVNSWYTSQIHTTSPYIQQDNNNNSNSISKSNNTNTTAFTNKMAAECECSTAWALKRKIPRTAAVLTAVAMKSSVTWDTTPSSLYKISWCFKQTCRLHRQGRRIS
jgi:hypothetical protein